MENRKNRGIVMSDFEYNLCMEVAGPRKFSSWARDELVSAAQAALHRPGASPGGPCGICGHGDAWFMLRQTRQHLCEVCAAPTLVNYSYTIVDKRTNPDGVPRTLRSLVDAVARPVAALAAYIARAPETTVNNATIVLVDFLGRVTETISSAVDKMEEEAPAPTKKGLFATMQEHAKQG